MCDIADDNAIANIESHIHAIWGEILGVQAIGSNESFIDLGGDSIAASLCQLRVKREFGIHVPIEMLLVETLSCRALARHVALAMSR